MEEKALKLHDSVLTYFDELETVAAGNAENDVRALEEFSRGGPLMGDRLSSLVFKDRTLLKAAKVHEKKRKRNTDDSSGDSGSELAETFEDEEITSSDVVLKYQIRPRFVWSDSEVDKLLQRAKAHLAYLRKLKSTPWTSLKPKERGDIREYIERTRQWINRIRSRKDRLAYECEAVKLIVKITELNNDARNYMENMHSVDRVVTFSDAPAAPAPVVAVKQSHRIDESLGIVTSPVHLELCELYDRLQKLATDTMELFGAVRYSGEVVQNMDAHRPTPKAPLEKNTVDPWITSGLMCATCGVMRVIVSAEAKATCPLCCVAVTYQEANVGYTFSDNPNFVQNRGKNYIAKNYAIIWLRKVKGELAIDIPEEVFNVIFSECYAMKLKTVNPKIVRKFLKKHGYTNYYNAVPFITYRFNEVPLPNFSPHEEAILGRMFDEALMTYRRCPPHIRQGRKSFISYSYFYFQTVTMHGWHQYKKSFPLLEGSKNLKKHDRIWEWICENRQGPGEPWRFIPTI